MDSYDHLIKINKDNKTLSIYRMLSDGRLELFTSINLPDISARENWEEFESFAQKLGENLLMDSPSARELLNI